MGSRAVKARTFKGNFALWTMCQATRLILEYFYPSYLQAKFPISCPTNTDGCPFRLNWRLHTASSIPRAISSIWIFLPKPSISIVSKEHTFSRTFIIQIYTKTGRCFICHWPYVKLKKTFLREVKRVRIYKHCRILRLIWSAVPIACTGLQLQEFLLYNLGIISDYCFWILLPIIANPIYRNRPCRNPRFWGSRGLFFCCHYLRRLILRFTFCLYITLCFRGILTYAFCLLWSFLVFHICRVLRILLLFFLNIFRGFFWSLFHCHGNLTCPCCHGCCRNYHANCQHVT